MGIIGILISIVCLFVAIERYSTNVNNVKAMNQMGGALFGQTMTPATPAATKYALLFTLVFGTGGGVLVSQNSKTESSSK